MRHLVGLTLLFTSIGGVLATWKTNATAGLLMAIAIIFSLVPATPISQSLKVPSGSITPTPVLLSGDSPARLVSIFPAAKTLPDGLLLSTSRDKLDGSIFLKKNKDAFIFGYLNVDAMEQPLYSGAECRVSLKFEADKGLTFLCDDRELSSLAIPKNSPKNFPVFTEVFSKHSDTTVVTKTWMYDSGGIRDGLRALLVACLVFTLLVVLFQWFRKKRQSLGRSIMYSALLNRLDLLGLFILVPVFIFAWPEPDDGNVLATLRSYADVSGLSNYYSASAAFQPTGHPIMDLFALYASVNDSLLMLRAPAFVASAVSLFIFNRILDRVLKPSKHKNHLRILGLLAFTLGIFAFGVTLRPEPFVNLLLVVGLANLIIARQTSSSLVNTFGISALTILTHQSGLAALSLIIFELIRGDFFTRIRQALRFDKLRISMWLSALLLFSTWHVSLFQVIEQVRAFSSNYTGYIQPFAAEINRYVMALEDVPIRAVFVMLILITVMGTGFIDFKNRGNAAFHDGLVFLVPLLSVCALLLTSSKWEWHFGGIIGLASFGLVMVFAALFNAETPIASVILVPWTLLTLSLVSVTSSHNFLGDAETFSSTLIDRLFQVSMGFQSSNLTVVVPWLLFSSGLLIAWLAFGRLPWNTVLLSSPLVITSLVGGISLFALGLQPFTVVPGYSYAKSNLESIVEGENCGLLTDMQTAIPTKSSRKFDMVPVAKLQNSGTFNIGGSVQPFDTYSSLEESGRISFESSTGQMVASDHSVTYVRSSGQGSAIVTASIGEKEVQLESDVWIPIFADGAISLDFYPVDATKDFTLDVSPWIEVESGGSSLIEHVISSPEGVVLDPLFYPSTPCLNPAKISKGLFASSKFMIGRPALTDLSQVKWLDIGLKYRAQYSLVKLGCPQRDPLGNDMWLDSTCLYMLESISSGDTSKMNENRTQGD